MKDAEFCHPLFDLVSPSTRTKLSALWNHALRDFIPRNSCFKNFYRKLSNMWIKIVITIITPLFYVGPGDSFWYRNRGSEVYYRHKITWEMLVQTFQSSMQDLGWTFKFGRRPYKFVQAFLGRVLAASQSSSSTPITGWSLPPGWFHSQSTHLLGREWIEVVIQIMMVGYLPWNCLWLNPERGLSLAHLYQVTSVR